MTAAIWSAFFLALSFCKDGPIGPVPWSPWHAAQFCAKSVAPREATALGASVWRAHALAKSAAQATRQKRKALLLIPPPFRFGGDVLPTSVNLARGLENLPALRATK